MPESGSKTSTEPVFWANFGIFRRDPNDFLSRLVTMDETWLYHYDPETKEQLMEWRHRGSPHPNNSVCKNQLEKFSPRFFGIKMASSTLIIFQRAKLSTRSITHLCWCNWRTFGRKNAAGRSPGGLVLARQCPGSPCTCDPEETGLLGLPTSWSPTLFWRSGPVGLPPVPWNEKSIEWSPFFLRRRGHFVAETYFDGQLYEFFFAWLAKVKSNGLRSVLSLVGSMLNKSRVFLL